MLSYIYGKKNAKKRKKNTPVKSVTIYRLINMITKDILRP